MNWQNKNAQLRRKLFVTGILEREMRVRKLLNILGFKRDETFASIDILIFGRREKHPLNN